MTLATTEQLDQLLDELEELARSDVASSQFLAVVLEQLRATVFADFACVMLPADSHQWWSLASSGQSANSAPVERAVQDLLAHSGADKLASLSGSQADTGWLAVPLRPRSFLRGYLLVTHAVAIAETAVEGLLEVLAAFAEVIQVRQQQELEGFVDTTWDQVQGLCLQLSHAPSYDLAAAWLVGGLERSLGAARVSLLKSWPHSAPRVQAISGVPKFNATADAIGGLQAIAAELQRSGKPLLRQSGQSPAPSPGQPAQAPSPSDAAQPASGPGPIGELPTAIADDGCFTNLLGLRLAAHASSVAPTAAATSKRSPASTGPANWLIIEFPTQAELIRGLGLLPQVLPAVAVAWEQQLRWLRLPTLVRKFAGGTAPVLQSSLRSLTWPLLLVVACLLVWALSLPYPLIIEADGSYEPVVSRAIYAADDGFVDELLVEDGRLVAEGEPLVQLRSPDLELRIEQVTGELRGNGEETSGVRIAINQLDLDSAEALSNQSRLASKIVELETKREYLQRQLEMLQSQRERLLLRSPISGTVVAKDLQRHLTARPVRRGDALFSVVDLAGPWQVRVQVADRDADYLRAHYASSQPTQDRHAGADSESPANSDVSFILTSSPAERWSAKVRSIAEQVENRHGQGCTVEVRAAVDSAQHLAAHAGAGVHAFFACGKQPLWFAWSRPMVEAVQRKLWFRNPSRE